MDGSTPLLQVLLVCADTRLAERCDHAVTTELQGVEVTRASTVAAGCALLEARAFDAIVAHHTLPDGGATDLAITTDHTEPALVIISPRGSVNSGPPLIRAGAQDYVRTAHVESDLARSVRFSVERQRLREALRGANRRLVELAALDSLTGLANRRGLQDRLRVELARASRDAAPVCALVVDLDRFKDINDTHGHATGDDVLVGVGAVLRRIARSSDLVGRVGGDEFVVLLPDVNLLGARVVGERLCARMREAALDTRSGPVSVTCSVGAIVVPPKTDSVTELLGHARVALAMSKRGGRDRVSIGRIGRAPRLRRSPRRITLIERSVDEGRLTVHAEPIHDMFTGDVSAMELRLRSSNTQEVSTASVLAAAFNAGSLADLDLAYLQTRLDSLDAYPALVAAHISVFPQTLLGDRFQAVLDATQRATQHRPVVLGLNASILPANDAKLRDRLYALRAAGVKLELLDVGGGRGAVDAALQLRPEYARLSADLVAMAVHDPERVSACVRIRRLLSAMRITVIADGVDSAPAAAAMREAGVQWGLGAASRPAT